MADERMIKVWRYRDAPAELQLLSTAGGDEDWLAVVPKEIALDQNYYIGWLKGGTPFGCCEVDEYPQPDGSVVCIGCHA